MSLSTHSTPVARMGICSYKRCPVLVEKPATYCSDHSPKREAPAHHAIYGTKRWERFRLRILRERRWCQHCLAKGLPTSVLGGCTPDSTGVSQHVHHIKDLADGGAPFDPNNVEALSHTCHSRETRRRQNALTRAVHA